MCQNYSKRGGVEIKGSGKKGLNLLGKINHCRDEGKDSGQWIRGRLGNILYEGRPSRIVGCSTEWRIAGRGGVFGGVDGVYVVFGSEMG